MRTSLRQTDGVQPQASVEVLPPADFSAATATVLQQATDRLLLRHTIVIIEPRALIRDCLARCLEISTGQSIVAVATAQEWLALRSTTQVSLVILSVAAAPDGDRTARELDLLVQSCGTVPTIVVSDTDDVDEIFNALDKGVRGYISTTMALDVAVEALRLVNAGGVFVPAASLLAARRPAEPKQVAPSPPPAKSIFTDRQAAIVDALRRGKANKVIAYELKMRESTVKVHVRNIMKKLKAKNRTEVAYIASGLLASGQEIHG